MKKTIFPFVALLLTTTLQGQLLPNTNFVTHETVPCPFNADDTITKPVGWLFYQTLDGRWDGPVDSTVCISSAPGPFNWYTEIDLGQIKPALPLFVRALLNEFPPAYPLEPDGLFQLAATARMEPDCEGFGSGTDCTQDICNGAFIGIAIPDSAGMPGGATRYQTGLAEFFFQGQQYGCLWTLESCFPSEKFDLQELRAFAMKFQFDSTANLDGKKLTLYTTEIFGTPSDLVVFVDEAPFPDNQTYLNIRDVANDPFGFGAYLMRHTDPGYPDAQHPSWIEGVPVPNTPDPKDLVIVVEEYQTLDIQPFVYLRGALVEGSDSIRHTLSLENMGGEMCLNFIDLIFEDGSEYRHGGGQLDLNNPFSCMQFRRGSALTVKEGATLHYGNDGAGMLALCAEGSIELERNATLVLDALLNLSECSADPTPKHIYMDLPPGARLVFTDKARLTNRFSHGQQMQLVVRMLGGSIDDDLLAPEDRVLIRRVYPEPYDRLEQNVTVSPNPFSSEIRLQYLSGATEQIRLEWWSADGKRMATEYLDAQKGINEWIRYPDLPAGFYRLVVHAMGGSVGRGMVKI